ncbi:cytochrome oxidase assembly protein ShyY1 [Sinorhizobium meliloti]|nr:hypothetical protein [Sinorhizobium meliloti]RVK40845.1 hypothetical protein CN160_33840 [Sinorhizobium meliloti]
MSDTELTSSPHSRLSLAILSILGLLLIAAFAALGTWQLERDAFRRNRKGDSFFCANQIHHSGR